MSKYWLFRIAATITPWLPYDLVMALSYPIALIAWVASPKLWRRATFNFSHVPGVGSDPARMRRATRGVFHTLVLNYVHFLRGPHMSEAEILRGWTLDGEDLLDAAMTQGRGAIILTGHYGNFELGASRLGAKGYKVIAPAERLRPEALFQLVQRIRQHHGFEFLPADERDTVRTLRERLAHNEIAVFAVDRYIAGASIAELPFFGTPTRMSITPVALALQMETPVFLAVGWRTGWRRFHGVFRPLDFTALRERNATEAGGRVPAAEGQEIFLRAFEEFVIARPDQWLSAITRVWPEPRREDAPAELSKLLRA